MTYATITAPVAEPLTLAETKLHLRLDTTADDTLVTSLIVAARHHLEQVTGLCLMTQTLRLYRDDWPDDHVIQINRSPVQTIAAITIYNAAGSPVQVSLEGHVLAGKAQPARLYLPDMPDTLRAINGIEVDFVAGFGAAATDVPDGLKRAMLMHVAMMYELRGAVPADMQPGGIPDGYARLIAPFQRRAL
jgi:uncharacterized phiE125 gp8 family phage protein